MEVLAISAETISEPLKPINDSSQILTLLVLCTARLAVLLNVKIANTDSFRCLTGEHYACRQKRPAGSWHI